MIFTNRLHRSIKIKSTLKSVIKIYIFNKYTTKNQKIDIKNYLTKHNVTTDVIKNATSIVASTLQPTTLSL